MPKITQRHEHEYQVSPRVVLHKGDTFRASKGPYYKGPDGKRVSLAVRGVLTFDCLIVRGRQQYIGCWSREGYEVIHVAGKRPSILPSIKNRPYSIRRVVKKSR